MRRRMTKAEAIAQFREIWAETTRAEPQWKGDTIAKRESWNNFTDCLQRDGYITQRQCDTWSNPF